jgi:2-haloacid dehalogenase
MSSIGRLFEEVGASASLAETWFASVFRDGFALTAVEASEPFVRMAAEALTVRFHGLQLNRDSEEAVQHIIDGFSALSVHSDVPAGIRRLSGMGIRLATLSNGSASVAEALLAARRSAVTSRHASPWKMPVPGNPPYTRTPTLSIDAPSTPWT